MFNLRKLLIAFAIATSIFVVVGCSSNQTAVQGQAGNQQGYGQTQATTQNQPPYQNITGAQAKQLIDSDSSVQIIDVREPYEFQEGHIQGAKLIPIGELLSRMGEIDKTKPVFIYCLSGSRSTEAAAVLSQSGYSNIYNLARGIYDWPYGLVK